MPSNRISLRPRARRLLVLGVVVACTAALVGITSAAPGAAPGGGVDPATVELTLGPGQSAAVAKHVTTPAVTPKPDIVILGDTTGSMDPVVANVRNNIDTIMDRVRESQPTARFAVTAYKEIVNEDKVFTVFTPLTDDAGAVRAGVDNMAHDVFGGGAPWTDFINAHFRIATDALAFRPGGSRVILWFGDAVSHDPSLAHTLADTTAALRSLGARVIAVPVVGTSGDGLDRLGQATAIVNATGGRLMANSNADQVADALLAGLQNLDVAVTPHVNSCDAPLTVGFDAASRTVRSGTVADFAETVQVRPDAAAGTYHCSIDFLVNGVSTGLVQSTTVHVPGLSIGDVSVTEGDSGNTLATFPVTLDRPASTPVTVHVATADGTAQAPGDFVQTTVDVRFERGELTKAVAVPIVGDRVPEPTETFVVALSGPSGAALADATGVGTILDNDSPASRLSVSDARVTEGNAGTTQAVFTISLDQASAQNVSLRAATADGTATVADGDYTAINQPITIPAGQTSFTVSVPVNGDTRFEPDETFTVNLTEPTKATIVDGQGVGTIVNDDQQPTKPVVSIDDVSVAEGNAGSTQATFTISLDRVPTQGDVSVHWATGDGTATVADHDYDQAAGDETFTTGQTSKRITVLVNGDTRFEPDETFTVALTNITNAEPRDDQGVGTIRNDDPQPRPRLRVDDVRIIEGDSGTTRATFTVRLDSPSAGTVRVHAATTDGTASAVDNDFTAVARDLTFDPTVVSQPFTVDIKGDTRLEPDETFTVELSDPENADILDGQGVGTIANDDSGVPPKVSVSDVSLPEGNSGSTQATFTISLDRAPTRGDVSVHWATADGTATVADHDYTAAGGDVVFRDGETSKMVTVDLNGDLTVEPDETFTVRLTNATNAELLDDQGAGTIRNDDPPTPELQLSIGDTSVPEGNTGATPATFTITLNQAPTATPVSVRWTTHDGSATVGDNDYQAATGVVTFNVGEASKDVVVNVNGDTRVEGSETFTVELTEPVGARIVRSPGTGTIRDDDGVPPTPRLSIGNTTLFEGNAGSTPATVTVTLANGPADRDITVDYATADGSATAPGDYTATADRLTFRPGEVSKTIQIPVVGDTVVEPDEDFTVVLRNASAGVEVNPATGTGLIRNDDRDVPPTRSQLSIGDSRVVEGNDGVTRAVFTVSLNRAPGSTEPIGVDHATADGTASTTDRDYTAKSGHLEFTGAKTSDTVIVDILGDTRAEPDEVFTVNLSNAPNADIVAPGRGTGTIANDDDQPVLPKASIGDVSVTEGNNGRTRATFTVTLDRLPAGPASLHFATANGSAVAPADYIATSGDVQFAGSTSRTITVEVVGDPVGEPNETFTVELSAPNGLTIVDGTGAGTIVNDDPLRGGAFTCTARALNGVGAAANPQTVPCKDDARTTELVDINLGLISIKGNGLTATTDQTPDDLNTPPAAGDNATAHAKLTSVRIRVLAVTIEVGLIGATATARCVAGVPEFTGSSTVTALKINGLAVPIGSGPVHIPLLIGSLDLNSTRITGTSVTQTAFSLSTLLGGVVIGTATAGVQGNPCR